jgi:glutaredoxin 3
MKKVFIYTTTYCGYCRAAKNLLEKYGVAYAEIDVTIDESKRMWLVEKTGQRTVPQIFFGETSIGGFTELSEIISKNKLNELLST